MTNLMDPALRHEARLAPPKAPDVLRQIPLPWSQPCRLCAQEPESALESVLKELDGAVPISDHPLSQLGRMTYLTNVTNMMTNPMPNARAGAGESSGVGTEGTGRDCSHL